MATVSEVVKNTFDSARTRLGVLEKSIQKLEKKAKLSLDGLQARFDKAPKRLEGAWTEIVSNVKPGAWAFATRAELRALSEKLDELAGKVEKLANARRKSAAS